MKKLLFFASAVAMLASCSKEMTDDVVVAPKGNTKIIATVVENAETRVHVEGENYFWDNGDGVGLFNAEAGDATNAYFGYKGDNKFAGEFRVMTGDYYYGYYPYSDNQKLDGETITLNIKATQNYSFSNTTFGAGVAPVVAKGPATDEDTLPLQFKPVASYLIVPVYGYGEVKKVELTIANAKLWGDLKVDLSKIDDVDAEGNFKVNYINLTNSDSKAETVTLNCGRGVKVSADPENPTEFWFVVPAQALEGKVTVKINGEDVIGERTLASGTQLNVNKAVRLKALDGENKVPFKWIEGGAYLIENEFDFIQYAYAATFGITGAPAEMVNGSELRPAMIINDLTYEDGYDPDEWFKISEKDKITDFVEKVVKAYKENDGILSIGSGTSAVKYSVVGNKNGEGTPVTITGLKVAKNNGVFTGDQTRKPSVSNITLTDTVVDNAYVFTNCYNSAWFGTFENITVNGTYETATAVGYTYTSQLELEKQPVTCGEGVKLADILYVNKTATLGTQYFAKDFAAFNNVYPHNADGPIVTVADKDAAEALIDVIKPNPNSGAANYWFSVVENEPVAAAAAAAAPAVKTSFWTGFVATALVNSDVYTAEEFAYAASTSTETAITLKNDIDLMGNPWVEAQSSSTDRVVFDGAGKTIYDLYITDEAETPARRDYTMFGEYATVTNINVKGVKIVVPAGLNEVVVATFAKIPGGTTEKAVVTDFEVTLNGSKVYHNAVGGLFSFAGTTEMPRVVNDKGNNTTCKTPVTGAKFGSLVGSVRLQAEGQDIKVSIPKSVQSPIGVFELSIPATTTNDTNLILDCTREQMPKESFEFSSAANKDLTIWAYYGSKKEGDAAWFWRSDASSK